MDFTRIIQKNTKNKFSRQKLFQTLLFIFTFCSLTIKGQSGPDFNMLADKAFLKLYQNPDECISYTQGILVNDPNAEHKIVLQNIISQAFALKGDYVQSVNIFAQKEDAGQKNDLSYFMQIFSDYNLADQYQNLGLYNQSKKIIAHLLSDQKLLKSNDLRITTAKLYQLQALNSGINRNYPEALQNLDQSNQYLGDDNEENRILKIENRIFRASYWLKQNKLIEYKTLIDNVIKDLEHQKKQPFLLGLAYENLSQYYFLKQDYVIAIKKLEAGLQSIENLPFNNLKIKIYESLSRNYYAVHDDAKYHQYNKLCNDLKTKTDSSSKEGIRYLVRLVENNQNKNIEFQKHLLLRSSWSLILILSLIILGLLTYFLLIRSKNKDLKKQFDFFEKQISRKPQSITVNKTTPASKDSGTTKISREKEDEILQKLEEFEKSDRFLNKNMSLSLLSSQMEINTKYLSEIINNKEKNFNGYINKLRINHIVQLLRNDATFLNYKVSYLAEYSGFSSHSAFTTVFKSVTGMSPNAYIQEISKTKAL